MLIIPKRTRAGGRAQSTRVISEVKIAGQKVREDHIWEIRVHSELDRPDTAAIRLSIEGRREWEGRVRLTDPIEIKLAHELDEVDPAFVGEVSSTQNAERRAQHGHGEFTIRGVNALGALGRNARTATYQSESGGMTDKDIIDVVLARHSSLGLSSDFGKQEPQVRYQHVTQDIQSDYAFICYRAARIGYKLLIRDKTLLFRRRDNEASGIKLRAASLRQTGEDKGVIALEGFHPRVAADRQCSEVVLRSWQPGQRRELVCRAKVGGPNAPPKMNGGASGTEATAERYGSARVEFGNITFESREEGEALAWSELNERMLEYCSGRGTTVGDCRIKAGLIVEIEQDNPILDGKYLIESATHWYRHHGEEARFITEFVAKTDSLPPPRNGGGQGRG
jgi:uncharacterized protein